jgi:hypothetical protein
LPTAVLGPVLRKALARLAAICFSLATGCNLRGVFFGDG